MKKGRLKTGKQVFRRPLRLHQALFKTAIGKTSQMKAESIRPRPLSRIDVNPS